MPNYKMENGSQLKLYTPIVNSSSTCIKNVFSEIFSSDRKIKSSYNRGTFMDPHALSKEQEMFTAAMCCEECKSSSEPICHVKLESVDKIKESTKQLLCLLEEIQSKTQGKNTIKDTPSKFTNYIKTFSQEDTNNEICDTDGLKLLEASANKLDAIYIESEHDNCSVYRRLTRKCHCLNNPDYNDFVIHFNEDSKYTTSNLGEIIKNMRILRKFLYMGGSYTRNALMFLNEGMMESPHSERVEMTQACVNADICNIFDDYSIVTVCISWPCKNKYYGDYVTQALAAGFLYKLAQLEEGRRYLNYSSKITNDIKKVMRKKSDTIEVDTIESLSATLNLLKPAFAKNMAVSYFKNSIYKGVGKRTICDLVHLRKFMTYDEVLMNLEMLDTYSQYDSGRAELTSHLPLLLILFKHLIMEYDNSEINVPVTNILTSIVSNKLGKQNESEESDTTIMVLAETGTQATKNMKSEECQFPQKKKNTKKHNKSKSVLGVASNKFCLPAKQQVSDWEPSNIRIINRSIKFKNGNKQ